MAFGLYHPFAFSSHPFFDGDIFDDFGPFSYSLHSAPVRRRRAHPRTQVGYCAPNGRCAPWRRQVVSRYVPSVLDLLSFEPDFERALGFFEDRDAVEVPEAIEAPTKKEATLPAPAASSSTASPETPKSESAVAAPAKEPKKESPRLGSVTVSKTEDKGAMFDIQLPGLSINDIKLDFDFKRHAISVKAEHKTEEKDNDGHVTSYRHVSISKWLPVPTGTTPEDIKADFVDGVLHISVSPKLIEATQPEKIPLPITGASAKESQESTSASAESSTPSTTASETTTEASDAPNTSESTEASSSTTSEGADSTVSSSPPAPVTIDAPDTNVATVEDAE